LRLTSEYEGPIYCHSGISLGAGDDVINSVCWLSRILLVVRARTCPHARSRPVGPTAAQLSGVLATTVDLVPLRADLEPARRDGGLGALGGLAMLVIDEAEASATVNGDSSCVIHVAEGSAALCRP
jgi:hypothetical protein